MEREERDKVPTPADEANDDGSSSDGDLSWARDPQTQDPDIDRSVEATIKRTRGR